MLTLTIQLEEGFEETSSEFFSLSEVKIELEHSLVSLSKWESKFEKPFLGTKEKTSEELVWYVQAMILTPNLPEGILERLSEHHVAEINAYINAKMTATWFKEESNRSPGSEIITAELIYYWMIALNVPFECQYWHLNRLLTLIQVCNRKNAPAKKMSRREIIAQQQRLNAQRRAALGTTG